jgi:hypothetical protein
VELAGSVAPDALQFTNLPGERGSASRAAAQEKGVQHRGAGLAAVAADTQINFTLGFDTTALIAAGEIFAFVETKALPTEVPMFELVAAKSPGFVPIVLGGELNLRARRATSLQNTEVSATVSLEITSLDIDDGKVTGRLLQILGSGTQISGVELNGCNPPVSGGLFNASGTVVGADASFAVFELLLRPTFAGTRTSTTCVAPPRTEQFESSFADGELRGTVILLNGSVVAIDFNRTRTAAEGTVFETTFETTGRLTP